MSACAHVGREAKNPADLFAGRKTEPRDQARGRLRAAGTRAGPPVRPAEVDSRTLACLLLSPLGRFHCVFIRDATPARAHSVRN